MQHNRHRESCYSKQARHYDSIIRINILGSDSLDACTCGGLYCSAEPLPMGFTLPHTRLAFKHLRPLSCKRLGPPATLTTWVSLLYPRLTDPLEFRDAVLTWILILIYIYITRHHESSPRDSWNYAYLTPNSCFMPYTPPLSQTSNYHARSQPYNPKSMCYSCQHTNFSSYKSNNHTHIHTSWFKEAT